MSENRYKRQIQLGEFGPNAQHKMGEARILVVGVGGLGIPVLQYLNAMGIGTLGLVEQDVVEKSNLHRQVIFDESDIDSPKIMVAAQKLKKQNPQTNLILHDTFLVKDNALDIIEQYDVVIDASDNFATRYLINDACVILNKPFVYGALHGFEGQVSVFNFRGGPTYRCLFPSIPETHEIPNCNEQGVLGVLPGIIGTFQALEVVKIISGVGEVLSGKLMIYNGLESSIYKTSIPVVPENKAIDSLADQYAPIYCDPEMEISAQQFQQIINTDKFIQLIDVRSKEEFSKDHLQNALNIPLDELPDREDELNTNAPIYLVCQSGLRSFQALYWLKDRYPNELYHLAGGIDSFKILSS